MRCCEYDASGAFISRLFERNLSVLPLTFTTSQDAKIVKFSATEQASSIMLNPGSTALPYEPYGYKIPLTCASVTTPLYLGEVSTVRKIKKLVLTGRESIRDVATPDAHRTSFLVSISGLDLYNTPGICSHFEWKGSYASTDYNRIVYNESYKFYMSLDNALLSEAGNIDAVKTYLASEYSSCHPVTIWYVLAEPETGIVNEPLMKIGDYCDELTTTTPIPTAKGSNTLSVDTTVQPSEVSITGNIKPV